MDLALEFGKTVEELSHSLTERELHQWITYAKKRMLPQRRLELYLAQIALWISRTWGSTDYVLRDFLFDPREAVSDTAETGSAAIRAISGGVKVIRLGQNKRRANG